MNTDTIMFMIGAVLVTVMLTVIGLIWFGTMGAVGFFTGTIILCVICALEIDES